MIKYFWSAFGYGLMSIPVFFPVARHALNPQGHNVKDTANEVADRTESKSDCFCTLLTGSLCLEPSIAAFARRCRWTADVQWQGARRAIGLHQPRILTLGFAALPGQQHLPGEPPPGVSSR